LNNDTYSIKTN